MLCRTARLLEYLQLGLVAMDERGVEQLIAHQVDDRLYRSAYAYEAAGEGITRQVAAEAPEQRRLPVQRQRILVLGRGYPGQCRLGEQAPLGISRNGAGAMRSP